MIKRFLRWGMAAALIGALALTSFTPLPAISSEEEVMKLTLEQAIALAEKNSPDIKLAAIAQSTKGLTLDQAKDRARTLKNSTRGPQDPHTF